MTDKELDVLREWGNQLEQNLETTEQHINDLLDPIVEAVKQVHVARSSLKNILAIIGKKEKINGDFLDDD